MGNDILKIIIASAILLLTACDEIIEKDVHNSGENTDMEVVVPEPEVVEEEVEVIVVEPEPTTTTAPVVVEPEVVVIEEEEVDKGIIDTVIDAVKGD